jgi:hypothetical protein
VGIAARKNPPTSAVGTCAISTVILRRLALRSKSALIVSLLTTHLGPEKLLMVKLAV